MLLCTFNDDTGSPLTNYVAEITSIDPAAEFFSCRWVDNGELATFQYSSNGGPWSGNDGNGTDFAINTHDIYSAEAASPGLQDTAIVTFADNKRYLCYVESITDTTNVAFWHSPYPRMSINLNSVAASDWDAYPVDSEVLSIERAVLDNEIAAPVTEDAFNQGWWSLATRRDAHAGRIGGNINPFSTVVHTTDVVPEAWNGVVNRWTTEAGDRSCAHFTIGRDASQGVIQLVPINRNANHAGGDGAGHYVAGTQTYPPNSVSVGIELNCAGVLELVNGQWRFMESDVPYGPVVPPADVTLNAGSQTVGTFNGQRVKLINQQWRLVRKEPRGLPIPEEDVVIHPTQPAKGWHRVTDYQYEQLDLLLRALESALNPMPEGCVAQSIEPPPAYGIFPNGRVVGHVSLTAKRRGDPWPPTCDWIRSRQST